MLVFSKKLARMKNWAHCTGWEVRAFLACIVQDAQSCIWLCYMHCGCIGYIEAIQRDCWNWKSWSYSSLVIYSYFCDLGHILYVVSCSIQLNHMATILQSWNNQKTCWILNCIGVLWTCIKKMCLFTHFCRKNVASRIYALF